MKQHLSVSAIPGPPVVTTIVPRISTAIATGLAPTRKRRAQWELFPPYIVYPPPPPVDPYQPIAGYLVPLIGFAQEQRKKYRSLLRVPVVVSPFVAPQPPETTVRVTTAVLLRQATEIRRRPMAGVRAPRFVRRNVTWPITVWLSPSPRVRTVTYVLSPPTVINP